MENISYWLPRVLDGDVRRKKMGGARKRGTGGICKAMESILDLICVNVNTWLQFCVSVLPDLNTERK